MNIKQLRDVIANMNDDAEIVIIMESVDEDIRDYNDYEAASVSVCANEVGELVIRAGA